MKEKRLFAVCSTRGTDRWTAEIFRDCRYVFLSILQLFYTFFFFRSSHCFILTMKRTTLNINKICNDAIVYDLKIIPIFFFSLNQFFKKKNQVSHDLVSKNRISIIVTFNILSCNENKCHSLFCHHMIDNAYMNCHKSIIHHLFY